MKVWEMTCICCIIGLFFAFATAGSSNSEWGKSQENTAGQASSGTRNSQNRFFRRADNTTNATPGGNSPVCKRMQPLVEPAAARGLEWLASRQHDDGSFGMRANRGNLGACGLAGMAFISGGSTPGRGRYGKQIDLTINYILAQAKPDGFINGPDTAMRGPMFKHGYALMFLAECCGMTRREELRETIARAVKLIADVQNHEGGWRYLPRNDDGADITVTVCEVMALHSARNAGFYVPPHVIEGATAYIKRCQNPNGGFMYMAEGGDIADPRASDFPRSAAAITALYGVGIHKGPEIARGLDYIMTFIPVEGESRNIGYYYYGQYYAAQAFWQAGGERFARWHSAVCNDLAARQKEDGRWASRAESDECATAMACIVLLICNDCLPASQR